MKRQARRFGADQSGDASRDAGGAGYEWRIQIDKVDRSSINPAKDIEIVPLNIVRFRLWDTSWFSKVY